MRYIISLPLAILPLPLMAEVPAVVTDIPPVHALVSQVMGDLGAPVLLLEKGADEHDFQLRPSQMQSIAYADVVIWVGRELTPWLDRALEGSAAASLPLLDASPVLRAKAAARTQYDSFASSPAGMLERDLKFLQRGSDPRFKMPDPAMVEAVTPEDFRRVWAPILTQGPIEVQIFGDFDRAKGIEAIFLIPRANGIEQIVVAPE